MDSVTVIAVASAAFGFGIGYLLAWYLTRRDLMEEITLHVNALRKSGEVMATRDGYVPWSAMRRILSEFPGQDRDLDVYR